MKLRRPQWPRSAWVVITVLAVVVIVLALRLTQNNDSVAAPVAGPTTTHTIPSADKTPSNLYPVDYQASASISELQVGETKFTTIGEPEAAPRQMVPLTRGKDKVLCLSADARTWSQPAEQVGDFALVNAVITRTGPSSYEFIGSPELIEVVLGASQTYSGECLAGSTVSLKHDADSRQILGLVEDFKAGQDGWMPASRIWVADAAAKRGYLLASVSRQTSFPGAAHVRMQADGSIVVDGSKVGFEQVGQSQIDELDKTKDTRAVVIA